MNPAFPTPDWESPSLCAVRSSLRQLQSTDSAGPSQTVDALPMSTTVGSGSVGALAFAFVAVVGLCGTPSSLAVPHEELANVTNNPAVVAMHSPSPMRASYKPRTQLGAKIMALREKLRAAGVPMLSSSEIEQEVHARRSERR